MNEQRSEVECVDDGNRFANPTMLSPEGTRVGQHEWPAIFPKAAA